VLSRNGRLGYIKRKRLDHDQRRLRVSLNRAAVPWPPAWPPQIEATYRDIETVIGGVFRCGLLIPMCI